MEEGGALAAGHGLDQGRVLGEEAGEGARADVAQLEPGDLLPHHALEHPPPESGGEPLAGDTEHDSLQRGDNIYDHFSLTKIDCGYLKEHCEATHSADDYEEDRG